MKKLLIGSIALLTIAVLAIVGIALLGPDGAVAQESDTEDVAKLRFSPLDEALDELVEEGILEEDQANAVRQRFDEKMPAFGKGFRFHMEDLPDGLTLPPGPPGSEEFDAWLDQMRDLLGEDFLDGHMFRFDEEGGFPFFGRRGPGMMGDGDWMHGFGLPDGVTLPPGPPGTEEFDAWLEEMHDLMGEEAAPHGWFFGGGDHFRHFDLEDLDDHMAELEDLFGGEIPGHIQDMIDGMREIAEGVESGFDA